MKWVGKMEKLKNLDDCEKLLLKNKYSPNVIQEILKWYDYSKKKGVASY
jgi:hypothetical protein